MRARGKLSSMLVAVAGVATLLIVASRWAGHARMPSGADEDAEPRNAAGQLDAAAAPRTPDLSFYRTLGEPRPSRPDVLDDLDRTPRAEPAPPVGATVFVVQVMVTRDMAQARRVRDRLAARGLPASVSEGRAGTQPIYRVRLGRYRDRSAAEAMVRKVRGQRGLNPWILQEAR